MTMMMSIWFDLEQTKFAVVITPVEEGRALRRSQHYHKSATVRGPAPKKMGDPLLTPIWFDQICCDNTCGEGRVSRGSDALVHLKGGAQRSQFFGITY